MTPLFGSVVFCLQVEVSSRPERSVVEGPAVLCDIRRSAVPGFCSLSGILDGYEKYLKRGYAECVGS
jgi:hypothetical protein